MLLSILELLWWFQPEASGGGGAPAGASGGGGGGAGCAGGSTQLLMIPLMIAVFYFLILRPQQKQQRATDDLQKSLKRGDKVRTTSGIRGEVAEINERDVNLIIADRVKINVLRTHVAGLDTAPATAPVAESKTDNK
ncbi:MAG: preprotein translocase subunit YajC [Sandaracinaceae bacterium]|nr:preprotein translocase subunit YajC [Sandaracinaceae bacterium]